MLYPLVIVYFSLIFSFKIPLFYNSSFLALLISLFFLNGRSAFYFVKILKNKHFIILQLAFIAPFIYASLTTTILGNYDFTFIGLYFSNVVYILITALVIAIFKSRCPKTDVMSLIWYVFILQSIIIALSFTLPTFHSYISLFQNQHQKELALGYYGGGVRGLALSGGQFFNLSALFSIAILFFTIESRNFNRSLYIIVFITLCGMTTGRTTIIGFSFGLFFLTASTLKNTIHAWKKLAIALIGATSIIFLLSQLGFIDKLSNTLSNYSRFAFEFIYNFIETGRFSTASTDTLKNMVFLPELNTMIFGDGMYTNPDGSYYMHTDSGFMRNIFLFGVLGLLCFSFYSIYPLYEYCRFKYNPNHIKTLLIVMALLFLLHYKGEVFGYLITVNIFIYSLFFHYLISKPDIHD